MVRVPKGNAVSKRTSKKGGTVVNRVKNRIKKTARKETKKTVQTTTGTKIKVTEHTEKKKHKIIIANKSKVAVPPVSAAPTSQTTVSAPFPISLSVRSPFRFPLVTNKQLALVARVCGIFFVSVGTLFAALNLQLAAGSFAVGQTESQSAQVLDASTNTLTQTTDTTTSGTDATYQAGATEVFQRSVNLHVEKSQPLSGDVPLRIAVESVDWVQVFVRRTGGSEVSLGQARRSPDNQSIWYVTWKTRDHIDGDYRIRVSVGTSNNQSTNANFPEKSTEFYVVRNPELTTTLAPEPTTTDTDADTDSSDSESTTTASEPEPVAPVTLEPSISFLVEEASPVQGDVTFSFRTTNATSVTLYARNIDTGILSFVGRAQYRDTNAWRLRWNSALVPDGSYRLVAHARTTDGISIESAARSMSVRNGTASLAVPVSTTAIETATSSETTPADTEAQPLKPEISTTFSKQSPFSGLVDVLIKTSPVQWVEVYALPKNALTPRFLGLARKISDTSFVYSWSTKETPNGDYVLYVRVKNAYGFYEGERKSVRVTNELLTTLTPEQEKTIEQLTTTDVKLIQVTDGQTPVEEEDPEQKYVYIQPVESFIQSVTDEEDARQELETVLLTFRKRLEAKLSDFARATRNDDSQELERVKKEIEDLKREILLELPATGEKKEIIDKINTYLSQVTFELQELTTNNETILKGRIGEAIDKDSDKDGITDYDEVHLYKTNPFAGDTDGDSFIDSAEIAKGFDPLNSNSEALVAYESPKDVGIVREDLLVVADIATVKADVEATTSAVQNSALISGKGLPNSFVTLYIFSTPIVVTVKTDAEGNWSYVFDKELEDGEHEVYAGITDNTGRVVAKSNPLTFVKTAEAFTEVGQQESQVVVSQVEPSLLSKNALFAIASIVVVALGLVLVMLGMHVDPRRKTSEELALQA